ncbi:hypothetical protein FHT32_004491 [Variovorax sp. SG517]|uniref:hypothetical protein n=1 Tax=Variovorax sp. SG517 TaxID=2587117 RepID=UPI00159DA05F|nr:hypothetical protein [Variovorax sp. SG517]NVM90834.1 hypothetical protein [Variovorax sp. SG517]
MSKLIYDRARFARLSAQAESSRLNALAANAAFLALRDEVASARRACQIHPYDAEATKILRCDRASLQALVDDTPDLEAIGIRPAQLRKLVGLLEQLDYAAADAARATEHSKQQSALVERLEAFIQ